MEDLQLSLEDFPLEEDFQQPWEKRMQLTEEEIEEVNQYLFNKYCLGKQL